MCVPLQGSGTFVVEAMPRHLRAPRRQGAHSRQRGLRAAPWRRSARVAGPPFRSAGDGGRPARRPAGARPRPCRRRRAFPRCGGPLRDHVGTRESSRGNCPDLRGALTWPSRRRDERFSALCPSTRARCPSRRRSLHRASAWRARRGSVSASRNERPCSERAGTPTRSVWTCAISIWRWSGTDSGASPLRSRPSSRSTAPLDEFEAEGGRRGAREALRGEPEGFWWEGCAGSASRPCSPMPCRRRSS